MRKAEQVRVCPYMCVRMCVCACLEVRLYARQSQTMLIHMWNQQQ